MHLHAQQLRKVHQQFQASSSSFAPSSDVHHPALSSSRAVSTLAEGRTELSLVVLKLVSEFWVKKRVPWVHQRRINSRVRTVSLLGSVMKLLRVSLLIIFPQFLRRGAETSMRKVLCMHHYIDPIDINNPKQQPSNPIFITQDQNNS